MVTILDICHLRRRCKIFLLGVKKTKKDCFELDLLCFVENLRTFVCQISKPQSVYV